MIEGTGLRAGAAALVAGLALLLAGCFVTPGRFASTLDLRKDGTFSYSYDGEIYMLPLSKLAAMGAAAKATEEFTPSACYDDDSYEERDCTRQELADQRKEWDDGAPARAEAAQKQAEQMKAVFGGIDVTDPKSAEELAARLRTQRGWTRVDYKGDGLFDVSFKVAGTLSHDFVFPTIERMTLPGHWVTVSTRADGKVRVDAPAFAQQSGTDPFAGMGGLASLAALGAASEDKGGDKGAAKDMPNVPQMDGTFRIVTDGQVLSNNTDEGPSAAGGTQVLEWKVTRRTAAAPMALVQLGR